jgi:hypothetical protein
MNEERRERGRHGARAVSRYRDTDDPALWAQRLRFLELASWTTPEFFRGLRRIVENPVFTPPLQSFREWPKASAEVASLYRTWRTRFNMTDEWLIKTVEHTVWTWLEQLPRPGEPEDPQIQRPDWQWHPPGVLRQVFDPPPFIIAPTRTETRKEFVERATGLLRKYATDWAATYGDAPRENDELGLIELARYQANELHDPTPDQRQRIRRAANSIGLTRRPRNPRGHALHAENDRTQTHL